MSNLASIEAEMSVLGSMILKADAAEDVLEILTPDDFFRPAHQTVFRAIGELVAIKSEIDAVTLRNQLGEKLTDVGGIGYLLQLAEYVPSAAGAERYAQIVKDKSSLRKLEAAGRQINSLANSDDDVQEILTRAQDLVAQVADGAAVAGESVETIKTIVKAISDQIDEELDPDILTEAFSPRAYPSKFEKLNAILTGFEPATIYVIGARPSMGKTSYAIDEACHLASLKHPVLFVSREMSPRKVVTRFCAKHAQVPLRTVKEKKMNDTERWRFSQAMEFLYDQPLYFMSETKASVGQIKREARRIGRLTGEMPVIFDDFIQIAVSGALNTHIALTALMSSYRSLAKDLEVPVVLLAQLSRGAAEGTKPAIKDLKESGSIEEQGDVVIFIHRPEYYDARAQGRPERATSEAELIVAKNREGEIGTARLRFRPGFTEFID